MLRRNWASQKKPAIWYVISVHFFYNWVFFYIRRGNDAIYAVNVLAPSNEGGTA